LISTQCVISFLNNYILSAAIMRLDAVTVRLKCDKTANATTYKTTYDMS